MKSYSLDDFLTDLTNISDRVSEYVEKNDFPNGLNDSLHDIVRSDFVHENRDEIYRIMVTAREADLLEGAIIDQYWGRNFRRFM